MKYTQPGNKNIHLYNVPGAMHRSVHILKAASGKSINEIIILAIKRLLEDAKGVSHDDDIESLLRWTGSEEDVNGSL